MQGSGWMMGLAASKDEGKAFDERVVRRLFAYLKPYTGRLLLAVATAIVASSMGLAGPYLIKVAIDDKIAHRDVPGLTIVALLYAGTFLVIWATNYVQTYQLSWTGQKVLAVLRTDLFRHLQRLSLSYYDQHEAGSTMSRVTNDVGVINDMLSVGLLSIIGDSFTLIGIVVIMLTMDVPLSLLSFTVLPVMLIATYLFTQRAKTAYRETRQKIGEVNASLQEGISGVRVVQSFSRERSNIAQFRQANDQNRRVNIHATALSSMFMPVADVLSMVATALVLWYGAYEVTQGRVTVGVVVAFITYVQRFFQPVRDMSAVYNTFQAAMAAGERIFELL